MASFIDNFREALRSLQPSVIAQRSVEKKTPSRAPQEVWGFEEDKANYGNERNGDNLTWRNLSVKNNDTGETFDMSIGYDKNGRISGVQKFSDPTHSMGYYGQDLVGSFFKENFDRDATDYTIFDEDDGSGQKWVLFDTKNDGAFIPSQAISSRRKSIGVPGNSTDISGFLKRERIKSNTIRNSPEVILDEQKTQSALNGSLDVNDFEEYLNNRDDMDFFTHNANDFSGFVNEFSRTPDSNARMKLIEDAYNKYGNNPQFQKYLQIMAMDEKAYQDGYYKDYDYERVGKDINDAINDVFKHYFHYA